MEAIVIVVASLFTHLASLLSWPSNSILYKYDKLFIVCEDDYIMFSLSSG